MGLGALQGQTPGSHWLSLDCPGALSSPSQLLAVQAGTACPGHRMGDSAPVPASFVSSSFFCWKKMPRPGWDSNVTPIRPWLCLVFASQFPHLWNGGAPFLPASK